MSLPSDSISYWYQNPQVKKQLKWDKRYLELAALVASWSKDPSTKVGAVIVKDRIVIGMGYNGFARGVIDDHERYNDRPTKLKFIVHAEPNAILNANQSVKGSTIYVWPTIGEPACCHDCAKIVIQAGIIRVVYNKFDNSKPLSETWTDSLKHAEIMFKEAGVQLSAI